MLGIVDNVSLWFRKNFSAIILHTNIDTFVTYFDLERYTDFKYHANLH